MSKKYVKDFDRWNERKKGVHDRGVSIEFEEGRIYWCHFGVNVGIEQDGKGVDFVRPVLVVRKFSKACFWGLPLTTKDKEWFDALNPYTKQFYYIISVVGDSVSLAVISQLRVFDTKRIRNRATGAKFHNIPSRDQMRAIKNIAISLLKN